MRITNRTFWYKIVILYISFFVNNLPQIEIICPSAHLIKLETDQI